MATSERWKDKAGEMQEHTEWHRISFFGRQAEVCSEYLRKGSAVYVEGRLQTRKYTDKAGVDRYVTEIRGDRMQMLGEAKGRGGGPVTTPAQKDTNARHLAPPSAAGRFFDISDDIIF